MNNPLKWIDPDGRDPKNPEHWKKFGSELWSNLKVAVSVGFRVAGEVQLGTKPVGLDVNLMSMDLVGVKDGVGFTPMTNSDKAEIKQGFEVGVGLLGGGATKTIKTENGKTVVEDSKSIGTVLVEVEHTTTTDVNSKSEKVGTPREETNVKVPNIGVKAAVIVGIDVSFDPNKAWESLGRLVNDK